MTNKLEEQETDPKKKLYLKIILSSAYHLHHIIEDALDMSRFDNKRFELFKSLFNVRQAVQEVCQIMDF